MTDEPFDPEPRTQAEYVKATWELANRTYEQAKVTNGRLTRLERVVLVLTTALSITILREVAPLLIAAAGR